MRSTPRKMLLVVALCLLPLLLSGCFLKTLYGYLGQKDDDGSLIDLDLHRWRLWFVGGLHQGKPD